MAQTENNRNRLANELMPETVCAVLKNHVTSESFVKEACRALVACIASEEVGFGTSIVHVVLLD